MSAFQFATSDRHVALSFVRKARKRDDIQDTPESAGPLLDLIEQGVIRIQDPTFHSRCEVIPGLRWDEARRDEVLGICTHFFLQYRTTARQDDPVTPVRPPAISDDKEATVICLSPAQVAELFWSMGSLRMADFFDGLGRIAGTNLSSQVACIVKEIAERCDTSSMNWFRTMLAHAAQEAQEAREAEKGR